MNVPINTTLAPLLIALSLLSSTAQADSDLWDFTLYVDGGYAASNRDPSDDRWASKSSTAKVNDPTLFLAMANIRKNTSTDSRWGFELGVQTGEDSNGLVTSKPPDANEPVSNADDLRHIYRANVSYLFGDERSVKVTGGVINSFIGYESFLAIENPNYTRAYLSDTVPYFLFGAEVLWDVSETSDLGFYLVNGYNYLTDPNDLPSLGFRWNWQPTANWTFTQNLYYGSDQSDTAMEFWRFFSDTNLEWRSGPFMVAIALGYGSEKQADLPGQPRWQWGTGALWLEWQANERLSLAFRPEFIWDDDGLVTGGTRQTLHAYTGTLEYQLMLGNNQFMTVFELRYDNSSSPIFPDEPNDVLRTSKFLAILGLLWRFES